MMKKSFIWCMVLALIVTSMVSFGISTSSAKAMDEFTDLKDLDAATKAKFDALLTAGIFNGVSDNTFGLKDNMNRAQFAKVAALIFNLDVDHDIKGSSFHDVKSDDPANGYALPYIEAMKAAGITEGMGEGIFNPAGDVTKEQLATFLVRGLDLDIEGAQTPGTDDPTVSDWAKGYVQLAIQHNLLTNNPEGTFSGREEADRELLAIGAYESAKTFEETTPLEVSAADFAAGNKLNLTLTAGIDADSIDLSKITINGVPLNPKLDSFILSEDNKTIVITLHNGFQLDTSRTPVIDTDGLKTIFGNEVKNEGSNLIPVTITEAPIRKPETTYTPSTPEPTPTPDPTPEPTPEPTPDLEPTPTPDPNQEPTPDPNLDPNQEPTPDPNLDPTQEPTSDPNLDPNASF